MPPRRLRRRREQRKAAAEGPERPGRLVGHIERERAAETGGATRTPATKSETKAAIIKPAYVAVVGGAASRYGIRDKPILGACAFIDISSA